MHLRVGFGRHTHLGEGGRQVQQARGSTGRTDGKGRVVSALGGRCLHMRRDTRGRSHTPAAGGQSVGVFSCGQPPPKQRCVGACVRVCRAFLLCRASAAIYTVVWRPSATRSSFHAERKTFGAALQLLGGFLVFPLDCFVVVCCGPRNVRVRVRACARARAFVSLSCCPRGGGGGGAPLGYRDDWGGFHAGGRRGSARVWGAVILTGRTLLFHWMEAPHAGQGRAGQGRAGQGRVGHGQDEVEVGSQWDRRAESGPVWCNAERSHTVTLAKISSAFGSLRQATGSTSGSLWRGVSQRLGYHFPSKSTVEPMHIHKSHNNRIRRPPAQTCPRIRLLDSSVNSGLIGFQPRTPVHRMPPAHGLGFDPNWAPVDSRWSTF